MALRYYMDKMHQCVCLVMKIYISNHGTELILYMKSSAFPLAPQVCLHALNTPTIAIAQSMLLSLLLTVSIHRHFQCH